MSKESLDYKKLCSNYYSSWEEGCCMESCEFYNHDECPVVYVNGLIADLEAKLAEKEKENEELRFKERNIFPLVENLEDKVNQDKISFAVEQIVKTKETLIKFLQDEGFYENEWYDLFDKIDNQIKQLKEGK